MEEAASNTWQALGRGVSAQSVRERRRALELAHERFIADRARSSDAELRTELSRDARLRDVVVSSWLRSLELDPDAVPELAALDDDELAELRRVHPMGRVLPVVQRLLADEAGASGFIVAVGDAAGRLLWLDGDAHLRSRAEDMGFRAGMDWSEEAVGTSAPGSALCLDHAIQVMGAEHYARAVHQWSCTAAPVHDPETGAIVGVIDVTGGDAAASPHVLPLVEATLAAVEAELKVEALRARMDQDRGPARAASAAPQAGASAVPRLFVLGRGTAVLECRGATVPLGGRHAEILLALVLHPQGLTAVQLAEAVYGNVSQVSSLRPELVRLRRWLEQHGRGLELLSKPYRLNRRLRLDALEMLGSLDRGAHRLAFAAYEGPVLPASEAPVAVELRADAAATLREAMLQSASPELLYDYAERWGGDDREVWETLLRVLPPHSPKRARVVARLGE